jgi:hypothetical protein
LRIEPAEPNGGTDGFVLRQRAYGQGGSKSKQLSSHQATP